MDRALAIQSRVINFLTGRSFIHLVPLVSSVPTKVLHRCATAVSFVSMRTDFGFSNVLGATYTKGNLLFTKDGQTLLSPIGNRVSAYDLPQNRNVALPFEV